MTLHGEAAIGALLRQTSRGQTLDRRNQIALECLSRSVHDLDLAEEMASPPWQELHGTLSEQRALLVDRHPEAANAAFVHLDVLDQIKDIEQEKGSRANTAGARHGTEALLEVPEKEMITDHQYQAA